MKRKVLCVFSLIAFLLLFCTSLAPMVQREMRTQVEIKHIEGEKITTRNINVANSAISFQETQDKLFQILPGSGWEKGNRIREVNPWNYNIGMTVQIHPGKNYDIILAASRQPVEGDAVEIVELRETEDTYLICCGERHDIVDPPASFKVYENTLTGALASFNKAKLPFFEYRFSGVMRQMRAQRIFSMTEVRQFLGEIPKLAVILTALALGVFLWAYAWRRFRNFGMDRSLWLPAGLMVALLCAVWLMGRSIDLPASMMPRDHFFNLKYYQSEFSMIFSTLKQMGSNALSGEVTRMLLLSGAAVIVGVAAAFGTVKCSQKLRRK